MTPLLRYKALSQMSRKAVKKKFHCKQLGVSTGSELKWRIFSTFAPWQCKWEQIVLSLVKVIFFLFLTFRIQETIHKLAANILEDTSQASKEFGLAVAALSPPSSSGVSTSTITIPRLASDTSNDDAAEVLFELPSSGGRNRSSTERVNAAILIFGQNNLFRTAQRLRFPESCAAAKTGDTTLYQLNSATYSIEIGQSSSTGVTVGLEFKAYCVSHQVKLFLAHMFSFVTWLLLGRGIVLVGNTTVLKLPVFNFFRV